MELDSEDKILITSQNTKEQSAYLLIKALFEIAYGRDS